MSKLKLKIFAAAAAAACLSFSFASQQDKELQESIKRGEQVYQVNCVACHMDNGEGVPGAFPPLAKSDFLMTDDKKGIIQMLHGASGEITVNGVKYTGGVMPPQTHLSDDEIADVLNYIRNSWGNKAKRITPAQVKAQRS